MVTPSVPFFAAAEGRAGKDFGVAGALPVTAKGCPSRGVQPCAPTSVAPNRFETGEQGDGEHTHRSEPSRASAGGIRGSSTALPPCIVVTTFGLFEAPPSDDALLQDAIAAADAERSALFGDLLLKKCTCPWDHVMEAKLGVRGNVCNGCQARVLGKQILTCCCGFIYCKVCVNKSSCKGDGKGN